MDRDKQIWYLSRMRAAMVQASLRIRAVSPEPPLLAHTSSESRGTFRQKARSFAPLNGWVCAIKICNDGMLEDTNSLDGAHIIEEKKRKDTAQGLEHRISCTAATSSEVTTSDLCVTECVRFGVRKEEGLSQAPVWFEILELVLKHNVSRYPSLIIF